MWAVAFILAAVAGAVAFDGVGDRTGSSGTGDRATRGCEVEPSDALSVKPVDGLACAFSIGDIAEAKGFVREVPEAFAREAFGMGVFDEALATEDGTIVGMVGRGSAAESFSRLSSELADRGWAFVESGQAHVGTFVKGSGSYRWLLLSCSEVGELVAVVVQVR